MLYSGHIRASALDEVTAEGDPNRLPATVIKQLPIDTP
jgi:hypothetical protein